MKHFKTEEWSDSMNHVASEDPRKTMPKHQGTGRHRNVETLALWQRVANTAASQANYQPAEARVRVVKAAFAIAGLAAKRQETDGLIQLLFDSALQPVLAGTRSAAMRVRQMLYRAEPYQIDLQIEALPQGNRLVVSGQLLDLSHPEMVGRDVQVTLSDQRENIVGTVTNQFGEFRAEVENSGHLELSFLGSGGKPIFILLRGELE